MFFLIASINVIGTLIKIIEVKMIKKRGVVSVKIIEAIRFPPKIMCKKSFVIILKGLFSDPIMLIMYEKEKYPMRIGSEQYRYFLLKEKYNNKNKDSIKKQELEIL